MVAHIAPGISRSHCILLQELFLGNNITQLLIWNFVEVEKANMTKKYLSITNNGADSKEVDREEDIPDDKVVLPRFLGLIQSISFVLGLIIGTGIFLTPTGVIRGSSGSIGVSLVMWVVGAFTSATGAMCVTELALYYRQSGGSYIFLRSVYGPALGFLRMWIQFFVLAPCSAAIQSIVIVNFLITPFVGECGSVPEAGIKMGASCVIRMYKPVFVYLYLLV